MVMAGVPTHIVDDDAVASHKVHALATRTSGDEHEVIGAGLVVVVLHNNNNKTKNRRW